MQYIIIYLTELLIQLQQIYTLKGIVFAKKTSETPGQKLIVTLLNTGYNMVSIDKNWILLVKLIKKATFDFAKLN